MFEKLWTYYSFQDFWHPEWIAITLILAAIYILATGPYRRRWFRETEPVPLLKKISFLSGLLVNYITLGSPLELLSSYLFSAHMFQMALYYLMMPPLLLSGIPAWMLRPLLQKGWVTKMVSALTRPVIALFLFDMLLSFYHFPVIFDYFAENPGYDIVAHTVILFSAFCMWWNITCPVPEWERSELFKMAYIVINVVLLYPFEVLIIFSNTILYDAYVNAPQLFDFLPPLEDQRGGGVLMNVTEELVLATVLIPIVYRWVQKQKDKDRLEKSGS